jgi:DNA polymerase-3 subunit gamma/tau
MSKINGYLEIINEDLLLLTIALAKNTNESKETAKKPLDIPKTCETLIQNLEKLEKEHLGAEITVSQVRGANYWLRLTPSGKRKVLVLENAEKMNDSARNSLLKILEEPPANSAIILTSEKPEMLGETILSRLRHYKFTKRSTEVEAAVIKRVFRDTNFAAKLQSEKKITAEANLIELYLDEYLPVSNEEIKKCAAFFINSIKENADTRKTIAVINKTMKEFESRALYLKFLQNVLQCMLLENNADCRGVSFIETAGQWKTKINNARLAVEVYNLTITSVLENLFSQLKNRKG